VNIYGKRVAEALDRPLTLTELERVTGFDTRYVLAGLVDARASGQPIIAVGRKSEPTLYVKVGGGPDYDQP
jgi:hypothetical protein